LLSHNQFPFEVTITHSVIRLILLQTQAMTIDFLLMSFNSQLVSMLLLITLFSVIIFSWMFLFIISIRSYLQTPLIIRKKHYLTHHHSGHLPFVSVIVPARNEQDNIDLAEGTCHRNRSLLSDQTLPQVKQLSSSCDLRLISE
jgi:hypothetical protein